MVPDPHITVVNPFVPIAPVPVIARKVQEVVRKTRPFILRYRAISRFGDGRTVMYYLPVDDAQPLVDLHCALYESIRGLIADHYNGKYNLSNFVPHVSITRPIPKELAPEVDRALNGHTVNLEARLDSCSLCAETDNGTWVTLREIVLGS